MPARFKPRYAIKRRSAKRSGRKSLRRTSVKARRAGRRTRRSARKGVSFAQRVFNVVSRDQAVTSDAIVNPTSVAGAACVLYFDPVLQQTIHTQIQSQLLNDTVAPSASLKGYRLRSCIEKQTYTNADVGAVILRAYYYRVRYDGARSVGTLYNTGFTDTSTTILRDDPNATPFLSPDFTTNCHVFKTRTMTLQQGESMNVLLRMGSRTINHDRYNASLTIAGSMGVIVIATGTLGWDTVLGAGITANVSLLVRRNIIATYNQLVNNSTLNVSNTKIARDATLANIKVANMDTGAAVAGVAGNVV